MRSINGDDSNPLDVNGSTAHEEKILVSVRLRPLNEKELSQNDVSDWECISNTTITSRTNDRPMSPTAYSFDRVFGSDSSTRQVYDEGAKRVALSVINGINASIFAYGQTSSGKTYTMSGVTEYTLSDIYNYVTKHESREFVLKFAAMEIYNECVRDLLTSENTSLRLLDDPVRGTVVEKLTEVTLRNWEQLKELLSVCDAQRKIGETALNEVSSRSHQILRLTVESSTRKYASSHNSDILTATVNFVDLAGSERASQTMSVGTRLKEGSHINRSLLTLGTVIRKLSKGRNGHVPYRDSKLTRILQNSLGGNARTAIICTLSPAHSHVEQSRNTLLFASCAKQVTTSAQVNVVMSEKALVKLLKKELARLEKQLKHLGSLSSGSCDSLSALQEKERLIEKMNKEIWELTQQRDYAHSRLHDLQRIESESQHSRSRSWAEMSNFSDSSFDKSRVWADDYAASEVSEIVDPFRSEIASVASHRFSDRYEGIISSHKIEEFESEEEFLSYDMSPTKAIDKYFGPDPSVVWEKMANKPKEVKCVEVEVDKSSLKYEQVPTNQELEIENSNEALKIDSQEINNNTSDCHDDTSHPVEEGSPYSSDDNSRDKSCEKITTMESTLEVTKDSENVIESGSAEDTPEKVEDAHNLKVIRLKDEEDKSKISSEDDIYQPYDCSTPIKRDYDFKCQQQFGVNSKIRISSEDKKIEYLQLQRNENVAENVECQKPIVDNQVGDVSSDEDKHVELEKPIVENHVGDVSLVEDENLECEKPIVDNHVGDVSSGEDKHVELEKPIVENHVGDVSFGEDKNVELEKPIVDNHVGDVSLVEDENLECEKPIVDNLVGDVSSVEDENVECEKPIMDNHVGEENLELEKEIVDNHVGDVSSVEDENLECEKPIVDNHVGDIFSHEDENPECEKPIVDNHVGDVSAFEDENLESHNQVADNHVSEDENLECHKQIADNHVSEDEIGENHVREDENVECEKQIADNHVSEDENLESQNVIVENHSSSVSSLEHENPESVVVSSIDEKSEDNHVVEMEPSSDELHDLPVEESEVVDDSQLSSSNVSIEFEKQRQEIIELWNACHVPLVHRTYFFLLFKGEPSDSIYMEVEQRRLSYLKTTLSPRTEVSSIRALHREREKLTRHMLKKFSGKEMESLYEKWGIALKSKRRRVQLSRRLWTNTQDLEHIKESAVLVAKLVGLVEPKDAPKEIFGLSLPTTSYRSKSWHGLPSFLEPIIS